MRQIVVQCAALTLAVIVAGSVPAWAEDKEPPGSCDVLLGDCQVVAKRSGNTPPDRKMSNPEQLPGSASGSKLSAQRKYEVEYAAYMKDVQAYRECIRQTDALCMDPEAPGTVTFLGGGSNGGGPAIQVTPAQAGAIAVARLKLPAVGPGIGPSPDLNRWNMAAVGYPLWLWADGATRIGPVSDSVAGLRVSLRAEVSSLTFRMGDGTVVSCTGAGDEWTEAFEPGAKAPNCGHTYTKPSLPKGSYTVSALTNWAVTWTANGQSGVINVPAGQTTELPVGELQVLVR